MNKKNLSVVMAGAMLATSVAPVLAATESSVSIDNKALLTQQLVTKMNSKKISDYEKFKAANNYMTDEMSTYLSGASAGGYNSAYAVKIKKADGTYKNFKEEDNSTLCYSPKVLKDFMEGTTAGTYKGILEAGDTIEVYERETNSFYGELLPGTAPVARGTVAVDKYTKADFTDGFETLKTTLKADDKIKDVVLNEDKESATVVLESLKDITDSSSNNTLQIGVGKPKLDLNLPLTSEDKIAKTPQDCVKFADTQAWTKAEMSIKDNTLVETIKVTKDTEGKEVYKVSDLYDGFAFTSKGTELMDMINNEKYVVKYNATDNKDYTTSKTSFKTYDTTNINGITASNGVYTLGIAIEDSKGRLVKELSVVSTNKDDVTAFFNLLGGKYNVGVVAGDNRYETAVNVDRAIKRSNLHSGLQKGNGHIVLVNGTSLVDGLAAAPLAASLKWNDTNNKPAPVLLSETDKLPTATKEYINELTSEIAPKNRANVTIDLVGGESVLSETLEKELKDMGFSVVRYGGDNREETSLEVAEAIGTDNIENAFVVGGSGEADAMSIAAVASNKNIAATKNKVSPIIVSSVHGLSKDAVRFIDRNFEKKDVTIVGGESVVSKAEETKIDEVIANPVTRVSGANRFETNAMIVEKYYKNETSIVAVKDGISNPSELVDALSAANYAATMNAPVVLASKEVKDTQKNTLLKTVGSAKVNKVVQVGNGAERSVLVTLADMFGVKNN